MNAIILLFGTVLVLGCLYQNAEGFTPWIKPQGDISGSNNHRRIKVTLSVISCLCSTAEYYQLANANDTVHTYGDLSSFSWINVSPIFSVYFWTNETNIGIKAKPKLIPNFVKSYSKLLDFWASFCHVLPLFVLQK